MTRRSARAAVVAAGAAVAFGVGASSADADNIAGYGCGLTASGGNYVIANCHYYAVYRAVVKSNYTLGSCRYIPARGYVTGTSDYTIIDYTTCNP